MFCCDRCGNLDSIRTTHQVGGNMYQCYRCINNCWHGYFEETQYNPEEHEVINRDNGNYKGWGSPSFG